MALVVGEAEVIVRANTAGLDAEIASSGDAGLASLSTKAEKGGEDAGLALSGGVDKGTKDVLKKTESDVEKSTGRMSGLMNDFGSKAKSSLSGLGVPESLLSGPAVAAVAFGAVAAGAIDLGVKMQKANASIAASSGISIKAATQIGDAFETTAGKSEHSAIDMATAFAPVAGQLKLVEGHALTSAQALQFMNTASTLATASGQDLGTTTATLAGVLQAFQLNASQAADASNILFNASNATGQGIDTLATSMEKLRAKLGDTAPPMSELAALTVDMTKNGITGRAAVTGLNGAVTSLGAAAAGSTTAGQKSEAALQSLGVSAKTASGQLTPMSEIIDKLGPKFATMTQAQQIATATTIFGSSAAKAMTAVIDAGTKSYDLSAQAVTRHNAVTQAASQQEHTLSGTFDTLKATVSDFGAQLGTALMPILQQLMGVVTQLVPVIGSLLRGAFLVLTPVVSLVTGAITQTINILKSLSDFVRDVFTGNWSAAWQDVKNIFSDFVTWLETPIQSAENLFTKMPANIKATMENVVDAIETPFVTAFDFIIRLYNDTIAHIPGLGGSIAPISTTQPSRRRSTRASVRPKAWRTTRSTMASSPSQARRNPSRPRRRMTSRKARTPSLLLTRVVSHRQPSQRPQPPRTPRRKPLRP